MVDRKRSASDDESEQCAKRRYGEGGHHYEIRMLVQSQVTELSDLIIWSIKYVVYVN